MMRTVCVASIAAAVTFLVPSNLWADAFAAAKGKAAGPFIDVTFFAGAATGDTCAHTRAGAVVDAPFAGTIGAAAAPGVACAISIAAGEFSGSTFNGLGNL